MLLELSIKDYILIEEATLSFAAGLNVLTGETGAGKSMVVGALELLLGKKASAGNVRAGAEKAVITAVFDMEEGLNDLVDSTDDVLVLVREIRSDGRTIARVNHQPVPLQLLRQISARLFRIHGQNEQLELFSREYQLAMLDEYAGHGLSPQIAAGYDEIRGTTARLQELEGNAAERVTKLDFLRYQRNEILQAGLQPGEDEELEREYEFSISQERIVSSLQEAGAWLGLPEVQAVSDVSRSLRKVADLSDDLHQLYVYATDIEGLLSDFASSISGYMDGLEIDPSRLAAVEKRLDAINTLKRKYGGGIDEIVRQLAGMDEEIYALEHVEEEIEHIRQVLDSALNAYDGVAERVSEERCRAAEELRKKIEIQLAELNMPEARLDIRLERGERSATGVDEVDMLIATAVGHEPRSLKKVVSGGELSRIMLAIQVIVGERNTMLFDEVDAGISGVTAGVVGEKLAALSACGQLICITHLPQIAVFADRHVLIEKSSDETATRTRIRELGGEERMCEIARLVGGVTINETALSHAAEMVRMANEKKRVIRGGNAKKAKGKAQG